MAGCTGVECDPSPPSPPSLTHTGSRSSASLMASLGRRLVPDPGCTRTVLLCRMEGARDASSVRKAEVTSLPNTPSATAQPFLVRCSQSWGLMARCSLEDS